MGNTCDPQQGEKFCKESGMDWDSENQTCALPFEIKDIYENGCTAKSGVCDPRDHENCRKFTPPKSLCNIGYVYCNTNWDSTMFKRSPPPDDFKTMLSNICHRSVFSANLDEEAEKKTGPKFDFTTEEGFKAFAKNVDHDYTLKTMQAICSSNHHSENKLCVENWNEILCAEDKDKGACCEEGQRPVYGPTMGQDIPCEFISER